MRYARIADNAIIEFRDFAILPDPNPVKGLDWRPCPIIPKPVINPATHIVGGPAYTVQPTQVVEAWTVTAKTAPELAADEEVRKDRELEALKKAIFEGFFIHENRLRALEGQPPVTKQQLLTWFRAQV